MSDELIRKSDVLNLLNNTEVGECPYNCVGVALIKIYEQTVKGFTTSDRIELINCETKNFYWFEIGKKVFLTREEAEKALEDLKNEDR